MANIEIYTKSWCPYCEGAKSFLQQKGLPYVEFDVTSDPALEAEMRHRSNRRSVPQIFVDGHLLGGFDDLRAAERDGGLETLLNAEGHEQLTPA